MTVIPRSLAFDMLFGSNKSDGHCVIDKIYDAHEAEQQILVDKILELTTSLDELKNRTCEGCKYLADNNVCVNSDCPLCCDFVSNDFCCNLWESNNVSK